MSENLTYQAFIDNILQTRGRFNCGEEYHERHHIAPKCLGGTNDGDNLIDLFAREHFEAHRLLALENPKNNELVCAWWLMCHVKSEGQVRYEVTAEQYEEAKIAFSNIRHNTKASESTKKKMSKAHSGKNNGFYGRHHSEETRQKIREKRKLQPEPKLGVKLTLEQRKKMSEVQKGLKTNGNHPRAKKVICEGKVYGCVKECAEFYSVNPITMRAWLNGQNPMPEKWFKLGLKNYEGEEDASN